VVIQKLANNVRFLNAFFLTSIRFTKIVYNLDLRSITGITNNLIYQTPTRGLLYVVGINSSTLRHRLEHLSCYLPGILALGASTLPDTELSPKDKEIHR